MPISEKQFAANRANAAKSTGPRSREGQGHSSQNARTRGFTAATFAIVRLEELDEIARLKHDLLAVYQPVNSLEPFAPEQMKSYAPIIVTTPWPTASSAWPGRTPPFRCFYAIRSAPTACTAMRSKNSTVSNGYGLNSQTNPFWRSNQKKTNEFTPQSTNPFSNLHPNPRLTVNSAAPEDPRWTRPASEALKNRNRWDRQCCQRNRTEGDCGSPEECRDRRRSARFASAIMCLSFAQERVPKRTNIMISCDRNLLIERPS